MKHIILFGPGTSPTLLVDDEKAEEIRHKFESGESFEVRDQSSILLVKENTCWAMKIDNFDHNEKE